MGDQCIVKFALSVPGRGAPVHSRSPMDDLKLLAADLLDGLDPHCQWDLKLEIGPLWNDDGSEPSEWVADVTARMTTRPVPPDDDPRPRPPGRPPRDR